MQPKMAATGTDGMEAVAKPPLAEKTEDTEGTEVPKGGKGTRGKKSEI